MDMSTHPLCPQCGGKTNTYRHPYAEVWCEECGFVLREEGEGKLVVIDYSTCLTDHSYNGAVVKKLSEDFEELNKMVKMSNEYKDWKADHDAEMEEYTNAVIADWEEQFPDKEISFQEYLITRMFYEGLPAKEPDI